MNQNLKILLIEDSSKIAEMIKFWLNSNNFPHVIISTIQSSPKLIHKHKFDLVILNWEPDDTPQDTEIITQIPHSTPIIMMSFHTNINPLQKFPHLNAFIIKYEFVTKLIPTMEKIFATPKTMLQ